MQMTGNTILVTGGTSGIGRGLAEAFHKQGNQVIIAGRRQERLDEITKANPGLGGFRVDLDDLQSIPAFAERVRSEYPKLNVLVNNAGIARFEDWTAESIEVGTAESIIQTNILSVLHLTAALVPTLREQPQSTIITTTSGLAFMPIAVAPTYCASKAFLHSWLQSIRYQLRNTSVDVLELPPPYVQTELGGEQQTTDPRAMPLADYIAEVMQILSDLDSFQTEILVERVHEMRYAEERGVYDQTYAQLQTMFA